MFLCSVGPPLVSPFLYTSYVEQQYDELLNILAIARSMRVPILMGDINTGPAVPGGILWEIPLNYGLITAHGFISPYLVKIPQCTWCVQNARAAADLPNNLIIDHIFITLDSFSRAVSAEVSTHLCMHLRTRLNILSTYIHTCIQYVAGVLKISLAGANNYVPTTGLTPCIIIVFLV